MAYASCRSRQLLAVVAASALTASAAVARAQPAVAFERVSVIPMDRERVLADYTVVVRGGRIAAMGPSALSRAARA